ncbi:MAG TPA: Gfo/Idh/MocA family oxidoreductase [Pirellulales bacterium]|nr:Gfo/Idh/MocA family oxidoreductase [Pirellulales bacterium]
MSEQNQQPRREVRSRRNFLKTSTAAAVGGTLVGSLDVVRSAHAGSDDTIKIGLIGCGSRGSGAIRDAMSTDHKIKLVAMGDAFEDRLNDSLSNIQKEGNFSAKIDVPKDRQFVGFDAYKKVLEAGVDLVILATPPGFRPIHFAAAVDAGKHVFMEKPVAVDAPGVRAVLDAAKKAKEKGLGVGVGLQRRHQKGYLETIQRLQDGTIGDILYMRAYWNNPGVWVKPRLPGQTDMEYQMRNWYYFNWLCGDHIVEQHIHNLDVINWVKNAYPVKAQGMGGRQVRTGQDFGEIYDHHAVEFEYADGSRLFSYCRHIPNCWDSVSEHLHGTKGVADNYDRDHRIEVKGGEKWQYRAERGNPDRPYVQEHQDLIAGILSGNPYNEAEYGALSTMTAIFGRMCTYSGKMISWEEAINSKISLAPQQYAWDAAAPTPVIAVPGHTQVV